MPSMDTSSTSRSSATRGAVPQVAAPSDDTSWSSDVVWGEFDSELVRLDDRLNEAPGAEPMMDVLRRAVVATNRFGAGELDELRIRMGLISSVPDLVAHS